MFVQMKQQKKLRGNPNCNCNCNSCSCFSFPALGRRHRKDDHEAEVIANRVQMQRIKLKPTTG